MDEGGSVFWDDLASDLEDPEFLREYVAESIRIATIYRIVNQLDTARSAAGAGGRAQRSARVWPSVPSPLPRLDPAGSPCQGQRTAATCVTTAP